MTYKVEDVFLFFDTSLIKTYCAFVNSNLNFKLLLLAITYLHYLQRHFLPLCFLWVGPFLRKGLHIIMHPPEPLNCGSNLKKS